MTSAMKECAVYNKRNGEKHMKHYERRNDDLYVTYVPISNEAKEIVKRLKNFGNMRMYIADAKSTGCDGFTFYFNIELRLKAVKELKKLNGEA